MAGRWVDVGEAARALDISTDAVRKRIARGSLEFDRRDGSVRVWLDDGGTEAGREAQVDSEALIENLRDQVGYLRSQLDNRTEELREHRRIIAALTSRIPAIEAPQEPPGASESVVEQAGKGAPKPPRGPQSGLSRRRSPRGETLTSVPKTTGSSRLRKEPRPDGEEAQEGSERPWWRRVFGG